MLSRTQDEKALTESLHVHSQLAKYQNVEGVGKHKDRLHAAKSAVTTAEHGCRAVIIQPSLLLSLCLDSS